MKPKSKELNISVTPVFEANREAYNSGLYRKIINQGGSRASKSYSIIQLLILICLQEKKSVSIVSPSLPHLRRGCGRDFINILTDWGIYRPENHNKTQNIYYFDTGSYVEFFGVDDLGKVHGPGRKIIFINESNLISEDIYRMLAIRTDEILFMDYNPFSMYSYCYDLIETPNTKFIVSNYLNNLPNLTKFQIEEIEALKLADENLYKCYALGERGSSTELVYNHWKTCQHFPDDCKDVFFGIDFGYHAPSTMVKVGLKDGALYAQEMFYQDKLITTELADLILSFDVKNAPVFSDSAEPRTIEELKRRGVNAIAANKEIYAGINKVKSYPLYITANSPNMLKEIQSYRWKVVNGVATDEPIHLYCHSLDGLRYAVMTRLNKTKKKLIYSYEGMGAFDKYGYAHSFN